MSDSVEEVKVSEETNVAEVTGVCCAPHAQQDKDLAEKVHKIMKVLHELSPPVAQSEEPEKNTQEKEDLVDKILRDLAESNVTKSEEVVAEELKEEKQSELNRLEELKAELEAKVESLEKENAQLEKENAELLGEEKEVKETVEAADTPDEESEEEGEEEEDNEEEEEESEEKETDDEDEDNVRYFPVVVVKERDNGLPFPIVCASSLLILVYLFKAFLFLCAMTGCNCKRNCICLG